MRILILIALLCNMAFSALYLNGATYTQIVTINHLSVSETNGHFLYQRKIPRTGNIALNVDSANDVGITRINDTTRMPRWVIFTTDTIYLYADIAVNSTTDTSYRLHYGKALSETNASATFTNCGYVAFWGLDGSWSSATDYASGYNGTVVSPATLGATGRFDGAASFTGGTGLNANVIRTTLAGNIYPQTIEATINAASLASSGRILSTGGYPGTQGWVIYLTPAGSVAYFCAGSVNTASGLVSTGTWYNITITVDTTNIIFYINGSQVHTGTITKSAAFNPVSIGNDVTGNGAKFNGVIDQPCISTSAKTAGYINDRYDVLFNASTFSTLGAVQSASVAGSRWGNFLRNFGFGRGR